ncbi:MAG: D-2-hydroxyacid dehydrogenase [Opitutales bacterium]
MSSINKIAILDSSTLSEKYFDWSALKELGDCSFYERTTPSQVLERAKDAEAIITNKVLLFKDTLSLLPNLKYIGILATGYNNVDIQYCKERGIRVCNIPAYSTDSVAQQVFAHILNLANKIALHSESVKNLEWTSSLDFAYKLSPLEELKGKTLAILGYGAIAKKVAIIAKAFDMNIIAYSRSAKVGSSDELVSFVSLDDIFSKADILSLNCALNEDSQNIISKTSLAKMKRNVWIINTARGGLINEADLAEFLEESEAYASVDVLSTEPPRADNPLLGAKKCYITPHNAWMTTQAQERLIAIAIDNLKKFKEGVAQNGIYG